MNIEVQLSRRPKGCECSFRQFMVGDGCQYCNPEYATPLADDYKPMPDRPVPMESDDD